MVCIVQSDSDIYIRGYSNSKSSHVRDALDSPKRMMVLVWLAEKQCFTECTMLVHNQLSVGDFSANLAQM